MTTVSTAHTATGAGASLYVAEGQSYTHTVTGTFVGTWVVEYTKDLTNYIEVATGTGTSGATTVVVDLPDSGPIYVRSNMTAYTSGTCTVALADVADEVTSGGTLPITDAEGTDLISATDGSLGFFGATPVDKGDAATSVTSAFTFTTTGQTSAAIGAVTSAGTHTGFVYASKGQIEAHIETTKNNYTRLGELETILQDLGFMN